MKLRARHLAFVLPLVISIAACDTISGGSDNKKTSLSFTVPKSSTSNAMMSVVADSIVLGGHTLNLLSADVIFDRIKLDRTNSNRGKDDDEGDTDSEGDSREEADLKFGATTVSLPLNGGLITPISAPIPPGTYESIEMKVAFVRVKGTFDGNAFDVTLPVNSKFEFEFAPPFVVATDADKPNITITIDPSLWFKSNGALIDPRLVASNETLRNALRKQIRASFRAFKDTNRNGRDHDDDSDKR